MSKGQVVISGYLCTIRVGTRKVYLLTISIQNMSILIKKRKHLVHDEAQQTELVGRAEDALERLEHGALGGRLANERTPEAVAEVDERSLEALSHEEQRGALPLREKRQRGGANLR